MYCLVQTIILIEINKNCKYYLECYIMYFKYQIVDCLNVECIIID